VIAIGKSGDSASQQLAAFPEVDQYLSIRAGKWRRYDDDSWSQRLIDPKTHLLNLRDVCYMAIGLFQSLWYLWREKPDVVFIKGGYVGVPVGLAAALLRRPFVTHDSDALAGIANRIIGRWAKVNAVAAPSSFYSYPVQKQVQTGVPISRVFRIITKLQQQQARIELKLEGDKPVVLVVGGSLGAQRINQALIAGARRLSQSCVVVHVAGEKNRSLVQRAVGDLADYHVLGYTEQLHSYMSAADLVVTRAGATTTAEIAAMGKPAIFIPASQLADQKRNATVLRQAGLRVLEEAEIIARPEFLGEIIEELLHDEAGLHQLQQNIKKYARPDAATRVAQVIIDVHCRKIGRSG
jgi:UDP-N-acetylglucosamine--N-acetylmuramyl-(pentapeptide) pyrophosphoryl-undecaprenol N-acetylglucosamine transferase